MSPDQEPLPASPRPLALLNDTVLERDRRHYQKRFDIGRDSRG